MATVILEGARTPFGAFGGALREVGATDLALVAAEEGLRRSGADPEQVESVIFGQVLHSAAEAPYLARCVALRLGLPEQVSAHLVSRLCGSGLQAVIDAAQTIACGQARLVIAGGVENMSQAPHALYGARWGLGAGPANLEDTLWAALTDRQCGLGMAEMAEHLAAQFALSRAAQDALALRSHQLAAAARAAGRLAEEIAPVSLVDRQGVAREIEVDEPLRDDLTLEQLASLRARQGEEGTVTSGNASGINDGAAALVLADDAYAREAGLTAIGTLRSWAVVGVAPRLMGLGAAAAARSALTRAELSLDDMGRVEINEAFAAHYLAVERELDLDRARVNVNGGAIALGHPLGASGARLLLTLLYEMRRHGVRYGLAAISVGGGQGIAAVVENPRA